MEPGERGARDGAVGDRFGDGRVARARHGERGGLAARGARDGERRGVGRDGRACRGRCEQRGENRANLAEG